MTDKDDFRLPETEPARGIAKVIVETIAAFHNGRAPYGGGCRAFYTPEEWAARGEEYGQNADLIVVHDGGDAAQFFNYDYCVYKAIDRMDAALARIKCSAGNCTSWYTAIYLEK